MIAPTPCPACGRYGCFVWIQYRDIAHRAQDSLAMTAHLLTKEEVVPTQKPRFRDRLNPMYYVRKELQKIMQAIERLSSQVEQLSADVAELKANITAEHEQQSKLVAQLKAASNGANNEAELNALADKFQASIDNVKSAAAAVKTIVPDEEPVVTTPPPVEPPPPSGSSL